MFCSILPVYANAETGESESKELQNTNELIETEQTEIESERDAYSKTYTDGEGNFTTEVYAEPVHTKVDGEWTDISTEINLNKQNGMLETETTQLEAAYPSKISYNNEIQYTFGKHTLEFTNISASNGNEVYELNQSKSTQTDENKVLYQDVLPGIDLRHVSLNKEVKEDWIIKDYNGINEFNYVVNTDLNPKLEEDGSISFYENKNTKEKVFILPSPLMEDSNVINGLGSGVKSNQLHYELESMGENQYSIKLLVEKEWLESEERVFPVYIDPSVSVDAMGDSFVSSAYPTTNYNKEWDSSQGEYVLKVGKYDGTTGTNYAFIKFSLTNLKGAVVDSADLKTYVTHAYYGTQKTGLWVDRVTGPWYANELTWNNKPGSTAITSTTVARDQWATFPVKSTVQGWINGTYQNDGFKFHTNGNGQTYWKKLSSAETANVAKLVISYHYPTMKNPTVKATQTADGSTTGYVDVSWPSVNGAKSYELQMYNGKSFETVYTGTGTSWSSKNKKIFPKSPYSTSSSYKLDGTGVELPVNPSAYYSAKSGTSTTRKEYGFKVKAIYQNGSSPLSAEVKKAIPASLVDIPDIPTVKAYAYAENDSVNKGRGWLDISWDPVPGATGYKVLILNGVKYEEYSVGNVTKWSTKGQKIWPTDSEIAAGKYALHKDKLGAELAINPYSVYLNSGDYFMFKRYSIRIKAESALGVTEQSDSQYGYIPLPTVKNISISNEIVDDVNNRGILNIKWDKVTDAGGYIVDINDGSGYQSYDVGNVTSWSTLEDENGEVFSLFPDVDYLPMDPTPYYKANGAASSLINKRGYEVRVKAYTINDETEPPSERDKIDGPRGLSAASATVTSSFAANDELAGLEDYYTAGTHTLGNGTSSVNVTTGNMNLSFNDHSLYSRGILDFDFSRYYNSKSSQSSALGKGWTFDGNEYFVKKAASSSDFYYYDEDGTRHEFVYNASTGKYTSPKGKYLQLKDATVNNRAGFVLTDNDGFSKYFEANPTEANKYRLSYYQDKNNNRIAFKYSSDNLLSEIAEVDADNNVIRNSIKFSYNADKTLIIKTSYNNRWIEYTYDEESRLIGTNLGATTNTSRNPITNSFEYNEDGFLIGYTDGKNNVNTFSYETNSLEVLTPQGDGKESVLTTYEYDKQNNKYLVSDTEGKTTTYNRDTTNNTYAVSVVTNSDGTSSKTTYDIYFNELTVTDELGKTETSKYDTNGNVISSTDKESKTTTFKYDDKNQVIEQVDPDGIKTINQYTGYNLISSQVGEEITRYEYDKYGRETKVIHPNNTFNTTFYNEENNSITITDAKGNTNSTIYNNYGETISETDEENRTTKYTLDELYPDVKTSVIDGNGNKTTYEYDANGNMLALIDANNSKKSYKYDGNDQLIESLFPFRGETTLKNINTYDSNGNIETIKLNSGITENYAYDEVDQLVNITVKNSSGQSKLQWINSYDNAGQLTNRIYKDAVTNSTLIEKKYSYTSNNLVEKYIQGKYTINYKYDEMDRINNQKISYDDTVVPFNINRVLNYTTEGKTKSIVVETGTDTQLKIDYDYDLKQNKASISLQNGLIKSGYNYDNANNLTSIIYTKQNNTDSNTTFEYAYDKSGNITKDITQSGTSQYFYNNNDQLIKEVLPNGVTIEYHYDKVGNRTKQIKNGTETRYNYHKGNQIIDKNSIPYTYDLDGNLIQDDKFKYSYNEISAQTSVTTLDNKVIARYEYDEEGLRTKKIVGNKSFEYYYEGEDNNLTLEITRDNNQIQKYRYYQWDDTGKVFGMLIKEKNSSGEWIDQSYYFLTNHRGDVVSIVNNAGKEVGSYNYDSFGNILSETGDIAKENSIRYASYYYDQETKHYYLKARYYAPENGNFLALDPHPGDDDDSVSQNGYTYADNNPVNLVDPDGNWAQLVVYGAVGAYRGYKLYKAYKNGQRTYKLVKAGSRSTGVARAWKAERAMIAKYGQGTRKWSGKRRAEILRTGKARGFQGHHINSVKKYPQYQAMAKNIRFVTRKEHIRLHGGNFRNQTSGKFIKRKR
ncbi:DNRLRE domain-containing protein [Niallia taxi]|uniref:DNRLRE domain-containing protein n=1 Tax=Niallia taxi TaxID=2499688 RepID=UPI003007FF1A